MHVNEIKDRLVRDLSHNDKIKGIGQTGDISAALVPGYSDIDLFVLCTSIPSEEERQSVYIRYSAEYSNCMMNVCHGGIWGYGDILIIDGIDVMFMYFTIEEMGQYLEEVLQGRHLDREGGFYPTGRLSSIQNISILYEDHAEWTSMKEKVNQPPIDLYEKLFNYHLQRVIDEEDLGRVQLRKEILFYHSVLENSLDHLLQALFALNLTYFPSRKRSEQYIVTFRNKPEHCYDRLLNVVKNSVSDNTIEQSIEELRSITMELVQLGKNLFTNK